MNLENLLTGASSSELTRGRVHSGWSSPSASASLSSRTAKGNRVISFRGMSRVASRYLGASRRAGRAHRAAPRIFLAARWMETSRGDAAAGT